MNLLLVAHSCVEAAQSNNEVMKRMVASAGSDGIDAADIQKKERVKARWGLLRQALLGNDTTNCNTLNKNDKGRHSMNAFPGFKVLDRTILPNNDKNNNIDDNWDIIQYSYTTTNGHTIQFKTREAKEQQQTNEQKSTIQSRVEALLTHRTHGVDNTGNVRVWDAEGTLAGFLLSTMLNCGGDNGTLELDEQTDAQLADLRNSLHSILNIEDGSTEDQTTCNVLELGAGQAGLAGLALASAASTPCTSNGTEDSNITKPLHVVLTDGHPKCVENNKVCAKMLSSESSDSRAAQSIDTHLLLWESSSKGRDACHEINNLVKEEALQKDNTDEGQLQLCLASDCVHFQEVHDGLLLTIARTLTVNGIALLCQPRRGTSLQNFMTFVETVNEKAMQQTEEFTNQSANNGPLFQMTLYEHFYPKVSDMHKSLILSGETTNGTQQCTSQYNPNWHQPLLLVLQKLRPYSEEVDGEIAREYMLTRSR